MYKPKRLKILKSKNQTFSAVCHHQGDDGPDDGKQPKTFGFYFLKFLIF